jgi:hypothetical protein
MHNAGSREPHVARKLLHEIIGKVYSRKLQHWHVKSTRVSET